MNPEPESSGRVADPVVQPRRSAPARLSRRLARLLYGIVRPVVRPVLWRLRGFLVEPVLNQSLQMNAASQAQLAHARALLASNEALVRAHLDVALPTLADDVARRLGPFLTPPAPPPAPAPTDHAALAEMRRLTAQVESAVLTLATGVAQEEYRAAAPLEPRVPLLLPEGRTITLETLPGDLRLAAALAHSGGIWEPHVQRFLRGLIKPDWVCADIGANIGVHTLTLAALARSGRVYGFEADPANFAVLARNAAALPPPAGAIEPVHLALWDRPGVLTASGADELSGCSFVSDGTLGAEEVERRLRDVVDAEALAGTDLHVHRFEVDALPLDRWAQRLGRLDFIKLDVEGAEAWVLRGAKDTIAAHRPVLLIEYNPACTQTYFGQPADALYHELKQHFGSIHALEADGGLTELPDWDALQSRLQAGKGWEDLVCLPSPVS